MWLKQQYVYLFMLRFLTKHLNSGHPLGHELNLFLVLTGKVQIDNISENVPNSGEERQIFI